MAVNTGESTTKSFPGTAAPAAAASSGAVAPADPRTMVPAGGHLVRVRWAVTAAMAVLVLLIAVRLALVDGLLRRVTITGPSMAPGLVGAHHRLTCDDCGFTFRCDATDVPASGLAVCPNCGYRANELTAENLQAGDVVLIDRWMLLWRGPKRGEVIAARPSGGEGGPVVKRVAALPAERLEIREGDLYAAGRIIRKTLPELRAVRMLVHDNAYQPTVTSGLPPRWLAPRSDSTWRELDGAFQFAPAEPSKTGGEFDWLVYHHWRCTEGSAPRTRLVPILDNDSFNQNLSRQLNAVTDILLTCQIRAAGPGRIALAARDGAVRHEVIIEPTVGRVLLWEDGRQILEKPLGTKLTRSAAVEFGLCDQQVLLAVAGRIVLREPYDRAAGSRPDVLQPLEIGAEKLTGTVGNLQVWRDLYYLEPLGTPRPWQADQPLASSEFALLGDNPPVSTDSREWPGSGGVSRSKMLGPVLRPFWSAAR